VEVVNSNGGAAVEKASACKSGGIARPRGAIPGVQVGGGTTLHCTVWVSPSPSLRHVWCHGHCLCTACGVMGAVVVPRVVSQSQLLRRMGVAGAVIAPHVVLQSRSCAAWCHGCSHFAVCDVAVIVAGPRGRGGLRVHQ